MPLLTPLCAAFIIAFGNEKSGSAGRKRDAAVAFGNDKSGTQRYDKWDSTTGEDGG